MEDELFDLLSSDDKPFKEQNSTPEAKPKTENLWEKTDFQPVKVDPSTFTRSAKSFAISYNVPDGELSSEVIEKLTEVAKVLTTKGYRYRSFADGKDQLNKDIIGLEGIKVDTYLPWKKFNTDAKNIIRFTPTEKAYSIAFNSHKVFTKLPPAVRAILSSQVHALLGKECKDPVDLMITYTNCGSEAITRNMDYKITGSVTFLLKICGDANIPVFNLKKDDFMTRFVEFVKSKSE